MAFDRSHTTVRIFEALTGEAMDVKTIAEKLKVSQATVRGALRTLLLAGEISEQSVTSASGRVVCGYRLPRAKVKAAPPASREEYKGEPRPLRYVPREEPYISLGRIG